MSVTVCSSLRMRSYLYLLLLISVWETVFFSFLNGYTNVQYAEQVTSVFSELVYCK